MNYLAGGGVYLDELNLALELSSVESIKGAVEAGMGIAVVSRFAVVSELEQGLLACIELDPPLQRSFYFVRQFHASRAVEELLDFVRGYCR
jgi:DNA-binding transcriptional LysR family regulator